MSAHVRVVRRQAHFAVVELHDVITCCLTVVLEVVLLCLEVDHENHSRDNSSEGNEQKKANVSEPFPNSFWK